MGPGTAVLYIYKIISKINFQVCIFLSESLFVSRTGMVGQLHKREVDLSVALLSINHDRSLVMSYTLPFMVVKSSLMGHRKHFEGKEAVNWTGFAVSENLAIA